jgi:negative regulator of flagellin synthesis FlgM
MSTQAAGKSSSFDAQKVQDIRAAIAEGRFEVNAENVADGLLSTVSDLIRSHQRSA